MNSAASPSVTLGDHLKQFAELDFITVEGDRAVVTTRIVLCRLHDHLKDQGLAGQAHIPSLDPGSGEVTLVYTDQQAAEFLVDYRPGDGEELRWCLVRDGELVTLPTYSTYQKAMQAARPGDRAEPLILWP